MQLAEFVTFTGRVDDTTLFKVLSTADVCVNPDAQRDEQMSTNEQDHGVHGAGQTDRANLTSLKTRVGAIGLSLRPQDRHGRFR